MALSDTVFEFRDTWYDRKVRSQHPGVRRIRLIVGSSFRPESRCQSDAATLLLSFAHQEQYVELGAELFESLKEQYRVLVDLDYINALPTDTARRLYSYLTKRDGKEGDARSEYSENLVSLAKKLPLAKTSPSAIRDTLEPALAVLSRPLEGSRKQFLTGFRFDGARAETKLTVFFGGGQSLRDLVRRRAASAT
jgi:predicted nucleotidyltransferase